MTQEIDERKNELDEQLRAIIFQALGEVSMCWSEIPKGVFNSDRAARIGEEIMAAFNNALQEDRKNRQG